MKKITIFCTALILTVGFFSITAFKPLPPGPSANGQGALDLGLEKIQHFSFHANTDNNGNVSGSFEVKSAGQEIRLHGSISCLEVTNGNTAFMSGVITHRTGTGFPGMFEVGEYVYFQVQDNGPGGSGDKFSDVYPSGATQFCGIYSLALQNIVNGNIKVKP